MFPTNFGMEKPKKKFDWYEGESKKDKEEKKSKEDKSENGEKKGDKVK